MQIRLFQQRIKVEIVEAIRAGKKSIMVQSATGSGKTVIATDLMAGACRKGNSSMFLIPRRELAYQTKAALWRFGFPMGIIMAGEPMEPHHLAQVASFDTLHARAVKRKRLDIPKPKLLLTDEAHLSLSETRENLINEIGAPVHVGFSATPATPRGGKPLNKLYDHLILGPTVRELIDDGYLIEPRYYAPSEPDYKKLKVSKGDYTEKSLEKEMSKPQLIGDIYQNWKRIAPNEPTVIFCVTRAHARAVCDEFKLRGERAEYVDGETPKPEREEIFKRIRNGETQVLVNVFVASYGLDIPILSCCVLARPTKSLVLYLQMVGRILRPVYAGDHDLDTLDGRMAAIAESGKTEAIIIDHAGAVVRLGFVDDEFPWTLVGDDDIAEAAERKKQEQEAPKELVCPRCKSIVKGKKFCPKCGYEFVKPSEALPTHKAELKEIVREGTDRNRKTSWEDKVRLYGEILGYTKKKGFAEGYANHFYREVMGVWPNDARLKAAPALPPTDLVMGYVKWRAIKRRNTVVPAKDSVTQG